MPASEPAAELDDLVSALRDVLTHYYDHAYLLQHPILGVLGLGSADPELAVQDLRRLLASAIQRLRPRPDTPLSDPAWRPYTVLHQRFIMGKDLDEVEAGLLLGRRQLLREQRKALEAVALAVRAAHEPGVPADAHDSPLRQEISRVIDDHRGADVAELLAGTLEPIGALALSCSVKVEVTPHPGPVYAVCNPSLLRQLMLAALSFVVRSAAGGRIAVALATRDRQPVLTVTAQLPAQPDPAALVGAPPEPVAALAEAQRIGLTIAKTGSGFSLTMALRSPEHETVVALVEDNPDTVRLFSRLLTGRSYRVVGITESNTALTAITDLMPDVVILDLMMSNVDGWEILQRLKADPRLRRIPVVICSVLDEPELATSLGAAGYLRKPVRSAQLLDCLTAALGC